MDPPETAQGGHLSLWSHRRRDRLRRISLRYDPAPAIGSLSSKQHDNTFLGNAYVDLGTYSGFTPYVGGGLGLNINSLTQNLNFYETANNSPYAADLTPTGIAPVPAVWVNPLGLPIVPQPPIPFALQNWNRSLTSTTYHLAWALSAGVGFHLTPSATLDVSYRYLNAARRARSSIRRPA